MHFILYIVAKLCYNLIEHLSFWFIKEEASSTVKIIIIITFLSIELSVPQQLQHKWEKFIELNVEVRTMWVLHIPTMFLGDVIFLRNLSPPCQVWKLLTAESNSMKKIELLCMCVKNWPHGRAQQEQLYVVIITHRSSMKLSCYKFSLNTCVTRSTCSGNAE